MEAIDLGQLLGTSSRTYKTRQVSADMIAAPIHVAIARWEVTWKSAPSGQMEGWVIAINSPQVRFARSGQTQQGDAVSLIVAELSAALANVRGRAWIVTGSRQVELRRALISQDFLVTGSFVEQNRAVSEAKLRFRKAERAAQRKAKQLWPEPIKARAVVQANVETHWWPQFSHSSTVAAGAHLRIATDASSDGQVRGARCFVVHNGDYQLHTERTVASIDELELDAISAALGYLLQRNATEATVESDSTAALEMAARIIAGTEPRRSAGRMWRGISAAARSHFLQAWQELTPSCTVELQRVTGHSGDPLNQAADRIALMGMRAVAYLPEESKETLQRGIARSIQIATDKG